MDFLPYRSVSVKLKTHFAACALRRTSLKIMGINNQLLSVFQFNFVSEQPVRNNFFCLRCVYVLACIVDN